jgi:hypothetical protein
MTKPESKEVLTRQARRRAGRVVVDGRLVQPEPNITHGKRATYTNWGCRCEPCTIAWREACCERRAARRVQISSATAQVEHGRASTYTNWGCRCDPCRVAATDDKRVRSQSGRVSS